MHLQQKCEKAIGHGMSVQRNQRVMIDTYVNEGGIRGSRSGCDLWYCFRNVGAA